MAVTDLFGLEWGVGPLEPDEAKGYVQMTEYHLALIGFGGILSKFRTGRIILVQKDEEDDVWTPR